MNPEGYGVIQEVGDLGMGYTELSDAEKEVVKEQQEQE